MSKDTSLKFPKATTMRTATIISKATMTPKERPVRWKVKNKNVQPQFNTSWIPNSTLTTVNGGTLLANWRIQPEMAIRVYKIVHAIGKTQFGGLRGARACCSYQFVISGRIMSPMMTPTPKIKAIQIAKEL